MPSTGAPPSYVRDTTRVNLVESYVGLHVQPAPQYTLPATPPSDAGANTTRAHALLAQSSLAERCATCYFQDALRRSLAPSIPELVQAYHTDLDQSSVRRALTRHQPNWRTTKLRRIVNQTIDMVVVPELERRRREAARIQEAATASRGANEPRAVRAHAQQAYARTALFGDLWDGVRESAVDVGSMHLDLYARLRLQARQIAAKLQPDHAHDFTLLQARCLARMQTAWRTLLSHSVIQIQRVRQRGRLGDPVLTALMEFEETRMLTALAELREMFTECVLHKTQQHPPLVSFNSILAALCGSPLRAARHVPDEDARGVQYDARFLDDNRLYEHGAAFFAGMRDHLHCLLIREELQRKTYTANRVQEQLAHEEAARLRKEMGKDLPARQFT